MGWLDEAEARANAADAGPWTNGDHPVDEERIYRPDGSVLIYDEGGHSAEDARFIASVREDAPKAYALIRQLGEALEVADELLAGEGLISLGEDALDAYLTATQKSEGPC